MEGRFSSHNPILQKISCELVLLGRSMLAQCNNLGTNAVLLLHGMVFAEVVSTCRKVGSEFMYKHLFLCTLLADGGIWDGKKHVKSVSNVQVLSGDMTDVVVKLHEVDPEADGTWWQVILVSLAKERYQSLWSVYKSITLPMTV